MDGSLVAWTIGYECFIFGRATGIYKCYGDGPYTYPLILDPALGFGNDMDGVMGIRSLFIISVLCFFWER
jgi:uncharacterized membrane protein